MYQRMFRYVKLSFQQVGLGYSSGTLFHDGFQHAPAIAECAQIALTVHARMLNTGYLDDFKVGFAHAQADLRLDLKAAAIYLHVCQAVAPESVIAVAQVAETLAKKHIDEPAQAEVAQVA